MPPLLTSLSGQLEPEFSTGLLGELLRLAALPSALSAARAHRLPLPLRLVGVADREAAFLVLVGVVEDASGRGCPRRTCCPCGSGGAGRSARTAWSGQSRSSSLRPS